MLENTPLENMSFVLGGLLIGVAIVGGGFAIRGIKVDMPKLGASSRILSFTAGTALVFLAVHLHYNGKASPGASKPQGTASNTSASATLKWLTAAQYQDVFEKKSQEGFYPSLIIGKCEDGYEKYQVTWKGLPAGETFRSRHGVTKESYDNEDNALKLQGYELEVMTRFKDSAGIDRYQAVWVKKLGTPVASSKAQPATGADALALTTEQQSR